MFIFAKDNAINCDIITVIILFRTVVPFDDFYAFIGSPQAQMICELRIFWTSEALDATCYLKLMSALLRIDHFLLLVSVP